MTSSIQSETPDPVQQPAPPLSNDSPEALSPTPFAPEQKMSNSPFAAMFKGGATPEDVQKFVNGMLRTIAREIKRTQEKWEKSQRRIKRIMAGQVPDD